MNYKNFLGIGALVVLVAGISLFALTRSAPGTPSTVTREDVMTLGSITHAEHTAYYDIATNYASSTPLRKSVGTAADDAAIAQMRDFVTGTVAAFKKDGNFANLTPADIKMQGFDQGRKDTLEIKYLIFLSTRTVSYVYTLYEDTGGAHGNTFFKTFTFDTTTGAPLALADLFTPGADYLGTLSGIARAKLPGMLQEHMDAQMMNNGTTPEDKNFENFFIDNATLNILFPPYQVASYAVGPQTLQIPLSELASILRPEYR